MQRWLARSVCALVISLASVSSASAQSRTPDRGMFGVTLSGGVAIPTDDDLEKGWYMAVSGEGYFTPRFSIRAQFGGAFHDVEFGGADGKVSPVHITGDAVYNWEHGKWHPYVSGGIGFYTYRFGEGDDRPTDFEMGFNFGGGVEFFFTRRDTITADLTFHIVPGDVESNFFVYKPTYWTIAGGYKHYF